VPDVILGGGVQSVHRTLDILEALVTAGGRAAVADVAAATGLPLATVHRLLRTLVERGYLRQSPDRRYALGSRLVPLGAAAKVTLGGNVDTVLRDLADELGETANLAVLSGDQAEYVGHAPSRHAMRMFTEIGERVPLHSTGVGKAMLAGRPEAEIGPLVRRRGLERRTPHTIGTEIALLAELRSIREQGFAMDDEEHEIGVRCVAVLVTSWAASGILDEMALSVSGPTARMTDDVVARAVRLLQAAATRLREDLLVAAPVPVA